MASSSSVGRWTLHSFHGHSLDSADVERVPHFLLLAAEAEAEPPVPPVPPGRVGDASTVRRPETTDAGAFDLVFVVADDETGTGEDSAAKAADEFLVTALLVMAAAASTVSPPSPSPPGAPAFAGVSGFFAKAAEAAAAALLPLPLCLELAAALA